MKRQFLILIIICLVLSLAGCSMLLYSSMSTEDILKLPDDEMTIALLLQLGIEPFEDLNDSQKVVYTAAALEMEVLNGGMVQFLSNEADGCASYVCEALKQIGAADHLALLQDCLEKNAVDLTDLSDFVTDDMEVFSALYDQYDFESFDSSFEDMDSMPELIRAYIQAHAQDF